MAFAAPSLAAELGSNEDLRQSRPAAYFTSSAARVSFRQVAGETSPSARYNFCLAVRPNLVRTGGGTMSELMVFGWAIILISLGVVGQTLDNKISRLEKLLTKQQELLETLSQGV